MAIYTVIVIAQIQSQNGIFHRISNSIDIQSVSSSGKEYIPIDRGVITYRDSRGKKFIIYASSDNGSSWTKIEYDAIQSASENFVYAKVGNQSNLLDVGLLASSGSPFEVAEKYDRDQNRMYVSMTFNPRKLLGRNTHAIGNSADDGILSFATNAKEISAGQFGQYPLYVFCKKSTWALEVGVDDISFKRKSPILIGKSLVGPKAVININGIIYYLTSSGLHTLPETGPSITSVLMITDEGDKPIFSEDSALGYLETGEFGRRELWIATRSREGGKIYCFSIDYQKWFTISEKRKQFFMMNDTMFGLTDDGVVVKEMSENHRLGHFKLAPIHFGEPELLKRIRSVILRYEESSEYYLGRQSSYEFTVLKTRVQEPFENVEVTAELRHKKRQRVRRNAVDMGMSSGYGRRWGKFW